MVVHTTEGAVLNWMYCVYITKYFWFCVHKTGIQNHIAHGKRVLASVELGKPELSGGFYNPISTWIYFELRVICPLAKRGQLLEQIFSTNMNITADNSPFWVLVGVLWHEASVLLFSGSLSSAVTSSSDPCLDFLQHELSLLKCPCMTFSHSHLINSITFCQNKSIHWRRIQLKTIGRP